LAAVATPRTRRSPGGPVLSRRSLLRAAGFGLGLTAAVQLGLPPRRGVRAQTRPFDPSRWPAFGLQFRSPPPGELPELDLQRDFGAAGDGAQDDGPALRAAAEAVNRGGFPDGLVINLPPGTYRVLGNTTTVFQRPVVLRGAGPAATTVRLEFDAQRSVFLRAAGQGMYVRHSTALFDGVQGRNDYPPGPFTAVSGTPRRGDPALAVEQPELFGPGDQAILLCDDYGPEVVYGPANKRSTAYLLKQYVGLAAVEAERLLLDAPLRHDFAGSGVRLYRWQPLVRFGLENLTIDDQGTVTESEAFTSFRAVDLDGTLGSWVWRVHFRHNTSIPLSVRRSRFAVVCECVFDGARYVGSGGNGYLPELYQTDDSLVEYCTSLAGRHALICNWTCWGNVFRYNRLVGTPNTETHGEYNVENLYWRNDARDSRMEFGGGGNTVHGHDGPFNELRENLLQVARVLRPADHDDAVIGNWQSIAPVDAGTSTVVADNQTVPAGWPDFPYAAYCGQEHSATAETARTS
jgi:pectate lyase-like protein